MSLTVITIKIVKRDNMKQLLFDVLIKLVSMVQHCLFTDSFYICTKHFGY